MKVNFLVLAKIWSEMNNNEEGIKLTVSTV